MPRSGGSPNYITDPEEAYSIGMEGMSDIVAEVIKLITPEDFESGDIKGKLTEKCWRVFEEKIENGTVSIPKIHGILKTNYERGIHDAISKMEIPAAPVSQPPELSEPQLATANLFHATKRAARYEKLLMSV